ncbi:lipocalin family protein [Shinella sp. CPCC 100929]|uniref:Lipocalin family protein n=1 Tax=Shinella lacus TaxID=2654216 RepID=A0ABT1RDM6_9HYPH|nr:lipocalin family protein [Shinella lacus]MCQ4633294.1 lipocalin family protein [Shinella lacus]
MLHSVRLLDTTDSTKIWRKFRGSGHRYPLLIKFNYWVLYKSPDNSWFISASPSMKELWIYSRAVPSKKRLERMVRKASELGYDVRKLEFPAQ